MSKTIAAFAWCLLAVSTAFGGWVKVTKEVTVPVGRLARVPIEVDADETDYRILGESVDGFREFDPDPKKLKLVLVGYESGVAFVVVTGQKGGKLLPIEVVAVKVGNPTPPPVPPTPPPSPPTPVDPDEAGLAKLADSIKAAAKESNWNKLADLSLAYAVVTKLPRSGITAEKLFAAANTSIKSLVDSVPPKVRAAIAVEFGWLPEDGAHTFSENEIERLVKTFDKISKACERASK